MEKLNCLKKLILMKEDIVLRSTTDIHIFHDDSFFNSDIEV